MHPLEILGNGFGLIRLNGPNKVPVRAYRRQFLYFIQGFLQVILTKILNTDLAGSNDALYRVSLAHGQKFHATDWALV